MTLLLIILTILSSFLTNLETQTLQSDFVLTVDEGQQRVSHYPGSCTMKGTCFTLSLPGHQTAYDGKTMYVYSEDMDELTLTAPTEEELVESHPLIFAKTLLGMCTVTEKPNKDGTQTIVTLTPNDPEYVGFNRFILKIRNADQMPLYMETQGGSATYTLKLTNPEYNNTTPSFVIEPTETTFVNDLRL